MREQLAGEIANLNFEILICNDRSKKDKHICHLARHPMETSQVSIYNYLSKHFLSLKLPHQMALSTQAIHKVPNQEKVRAFHFNTRFLFVSVLKWNGVQHNCCSEMKGGLTDRCDNLTGLE